MTKKERLAFVKKKSKQKRFIMESCKPFSLELFDEDPLLKKELNVVLFNEEQTKLELFLRDEISVELVAQHMAKTLGISVDGIRTIEKGNSISNLLLA
ncbi:hypothetical protein [Vagococcus fluvialis]|uniref:hypothetical protein n=1 Tax=Vagococcus fluvialis TaxID=2738 RepID=UPI0037AAAE4F